MGSDQPLRILLVEDHRETREALSIWLSDLGHEVEGVDSIAGAKTTAARFPFEMLIADLNLPDGNGRDLLRELKQLHDFYAVAITGDGGRNNRTLSHQAGFAEHLEKPVDLDEMTEALGHAAAQASDCDTN
jgi:DNA-binding NtrC family response regulator